MIHTHTPAQSLDKQQQIYSNYNRKCNKSDASMFNLNLLF